MSRLSPLAAVLLLAAAATNAQAPAPAGKPATPVAESESLPLPQAPATDAVLEGRGAGHYLLRALGSLVIVAGIVVACYYLGLRLRAGGRLASGGPIEVLHTKALGPGRALHLVEVEGRRLLVGSSQNGVWLIRELDERPREENATGP